MVNNIEFKLLDVTETYSDQGEDPKKFFINHCDEE